MRYLRPDLRIVTSAVCMKLRCVILSLVFIIAQLLPVLALQDASQASADNHSSIQIHQTSLTNLDFAVFAEDIDKDEKDENLQLSMLPVFVTAFLLSSNTQIQLEEQWLFSQRDFFKHRPEPDDKRLTTKQFRI